MDIAERIKQARKTAGLTQAELAVAVDVSQPTVNGWERGAFVPARDRVDQIAGATDTSRQWLEFGEEAAVPADPAVGDPEPRSATASTEITSTAGADSQSSVPPPSSSGADQLNSMAVAVDDVITRSCGGGGLSAVTTVPLDRAPVPLALLAETW